ncbi:MAG: TetR/AcrR family transcriptional regulator [Oscillospiraceae bacterium]|nr:TetR/AcrR family transcriptional regulator [Oscillospiraceae bacterium]
MAQSTKQALAASLKKMLEKRNLDDITVKELVEDCQVNRQTFYYHFQDIFDLLAWFLEREFSALMPERCTTGNWQDTLLHITHYVKGHYKLMLHIYSSNGQQVFNQELNRVSLQMMYEVVESSGDGLSIAEEDKRFVANFYKCALTGIFADWLSRGMEEDPAQLVAKAGILLDGAFRRGVACFSKDS